MKYVYRNKKAKSFGRARLALFTILLLLVSILCFGLEYERETKTEVVSNTTPKKVVKEVEAKEPKPDYNFTEEERYLLAKIAMAEAEGEDTKGKALVISVVLNRVSHQEFPNSIKEVIYQNSNGVYQFSPIYDGRWYEVEPNKDCYRAVSMVEYGYDESAGALYFISGNAEGTWHDVACEYLFTHGCHKFYY